MSFGPVQAHPDCEGGTVLKAFRSHIRSNVVGYLALVVAMSGTGAWAADKITSSDIAKNAVRAKHIKAASVTEPKIAPGAVNAGKLAADVDNTQILWANVENNFGTPTLIRGKGATGVANSGDGIRVSFNRSVRDCTYQSTGWLNLGGGGGFYVTAPIMVAEHGSAIPANVVEVEAYNGNTGSLENSNYDFTVA